MKKKPSTIICCLLLLLVTIGCCVCFCACQPQPYNNTFEANSIRSIDEFYGTYDHNQLFPTYYRYLPWNPKRAKDVSIDYIPAPATGDLRQTISEAYRITTHGYYCLGNSADGPYYIPLYVPQEIPTEVVNDINQVLSPLYGKITISPGSVHFVNSGLQYDFDTTPTEDQKFILYQTEDDNSWIKITMKPFAWPENNPQKYCYITYHRRIRNKSSLTITLLKEFTDNDQL